MSNRTPSPHEPVARLTLHASLVGSPLGRKRRNIAEQNTVLLAAISGAGRRPVNARRPLPVEPVIAATLLWGPGWLIMRPAGRRAHEAVSNRL